MGGDSHFRNGQRRRFTKRIPGQFRDMRNNQRIAGKPEVEVQNKLFEPDLSLPELILYEILGSTMKKNGVRQLGNFRLRKLDRLGNFGRIKKLRVDLEDGRRLLSGRSRTSPHDKTDDRTGWIHAPHISLRSTLGTIGNSVCVNAGASPTPSCTGGLGVRIRDATRDTALFAYDASS